ncbi:MAG: hypothetical protein RLZZ255_324 [Cyanobacteriota bacterium]
MTGMAAQGPLPAGMLRIRQGSQERYVWPVHLPGWLGLGWQVAGAEAAAGTSLVGGAAAEPPAPIAAAAGELLEQDDAKPSSNRGRRGRRRKEEPLPAAPADTGTSTVGDASESDGIEEPDLDPDPTAEVPVLTALPDDLFDDPLI